MIKENLTTENIDLNLMQNNLFSKKLISKKLQISMKIIKMHCEILEINMSKMNKILFLIASIMKMFVLKKVLMFQMILNLVKKNMD